jgi:rod shape-determining protein MreD
MWDASTPESGVRGRVFAAATALLLAAVILQVCVVARLNLPLGRPDLVIMLLAAVALIEGPVPGALLGFVVGLAGDLFSTHVLGQSALMLCLVGYGAGLVVGVAERSVLGPLLTVSAAAALGTLGHAATAALLDDAGVTAAEATRRAFAAGLYAVLATPFLFPLVLAGSRRVSGEPR